MTAKSMARIIKRWRKQNTLGQKQAAKMLGVSLRALRSYEQEYRRPSKFARIAILGIIQP